MKIKMIKNAFIKGEIASTGDVLDVDDSDGRILVQGLKAERVQTAEEGSTEQQPAPKKKAGKRGKRGKK